MTTAYDNVDEQDLPGLLFVKSHFWDKGQSGVPVYLRRRTVPELGGQWIWLVCRAVEYVHAPIPAIILLESYVHDEEFAMRINRITRITAILVQAVEASFLVGSNRPTDDEDAREEEKDELALPPQDQLTSSEDLAAYQSILDSMSASGMSTDDINLIRIAVSGGNAAGGAATAESQMEQELKENVTGAQKKTFDPWSMIQSVREGVRLDLGLTRLYPDEIKMITLVLSGKLAVNQVAPMMINALQSGGSLKDAFRHFQLDSERQSPLSPSSHNVSGSMGRSGHGSNNRRLSLNIPPQLQSSPPPIAVVNLSYTYIGNAGMEMLSEIINSELSCLKTLDISFCKIEEKGLLSLARTLAKRKRRGLPPLRGLILSGNYVSVRSAAELGFALTPSEKVTKHVRKRCRDTAARKTGYDSDETSDDDDDDEDEFSSAANSKRKNKKQPIHETPEKRERHELKVLHLANCSMTADAISRLFDGLGPKSKIQELNLSSNQFGTGGASVLVKFLESRQKFVPMECLDRLDMSNNNLGDDGTTQLAKIISKRTKSPLVDLKLSSNAIGAGGVETIMNKLLQHELRSLSLDKNAIGDQGCQLVAASLQSMTALSRLNLSFNQIGSRGITSLMRSLIGCESITYLGLSGNIVRIPGAIALAYTLAQHPRLEELDLDNCCLGQAAQCHISTGIISNRWVPMKRVRGFAAGPPMVAIGALKPSLQDEPNEVCFRIRKDEQMKTILQWMENNRLSKNQRSNNGVDPELAAALGTNSQDRRFLSPDFVSTINDIHGSPSQNAYFRLLGWLSRIPFDEDELTSLQKYFYDPDGGEGDRGSDGHINLKLRGDLLAALDSEVAGEIRDELPSLLPSLKGSVGLDLEKLCAGTEWNTWKSFQGELADAPASVAIEKPVVDDAIEVEPENEVHEHNDMFDGVGMGERNSEDSECGLTRSKNVLGQSESVGSNMDKERRSKVKPRITMFPQFEQQLEELKATAMDMIENEEDPMQHQVILTQYAEASLTILRQLRYHCMNSGLDGWRHTGLKRKILVIDDSGVTRKMVKRAFENADFFVDTASNGAEGVEKLKQSIYDIAFMDIDMPVMNGFEATKKLREWEDKMRPGARQPICALTATYVDDFERSELMKFKDAGLDVMESKPINLPRLFKVVDDVSPMFSDLSIHVLQRERSDSKLSDGNRSDATA
jgi:CheY-like chemotaxis protein